ncbi:DNA internalization-related competence protein ComEC/Rec2 [Thiorhodococcus mannitoliphagus]|uniref:DNA internalization-related competence protein ComEC/Rec2 n=1 Tax=Thiorhodococcus mannitoliphagus TaxID=329406 RepID=A0A6P1DSD3_9GAMM|nr:DNA internalization-related competence protein ComEC/Rec2 [Thiorhodococcus mannitoliphagus]NEX19606.1 DNA internalization-related competence protein ComEC/Rec2 [Thiorhodococcus mannitoliphagus]
MISRQPLTLGLAFALGAAGFHLMPEMPPPWLGGGLVVVFGLLAWRAVWLRPLVLILLGGCWAQWHACLTLCEPFPDVLARAPLVVEGRIASLPVQRSHSTRFRFEIEQTTLDGEVLPFRGLVRLSCYRDCPELKAGARWRLPVRLKPRHGFANPGGFDYERWLFEAGILATGYTRSGPEQQRLDAGPGRFWLTRWRQALAEHLAAVLGESSQLGLVQALTVGERSGVDSTTWEVFTRTGTNHLMAISGLHVGLIAAAVFFMARLGWGLSAGALSLLAAPRAAAIAAGLAALFYAGLAGFAISTQRALIMLAVVLGAVLWRRTLRPYHALVVALAGVLLWDPQAVLSYGFWLSFGAVALLIFNLGQRLPSRDLWTRWGRAQWAIGLGLMPLLLLFFAKASVIAPLANLVAVPLFSLLLLPLVLLSTLLSLIPGLEWPLRLTADLLDLAVRGLGWLAHQPWAAVPLSSRHLWVWGLAGAGVILLLAPRGLPGRWLGGILLLPLLWVRPAHPLPGEAWVTLLDVGQGLSLVVQTAAGTLVYDTGPAYPSGFETGSTVVAPFLRAQGIHHLDRLVLSHADRDHAGGAAGLMDAVEVGRTQSGEPTELDIPGAEACRAGESWEWSGVSFRYLHPPGHGETGNDASCVLMIRTAGTALLVMGDVERSVELELVARLDNALDADVLIVGHHGSRTSTSAELVQAVSPQWALVSSGYANAFGFPTQEVVRRLRASGARVLDTASMGAIRFAMGPSGLMTPPIGDREEHRRLWTHRPAPSWQLKQGGTDEEQ